MKTIFTFILLSSFFSSFGQLYNSSGSTIFVSDGDYLYTGINFENDGTFQIGTTANATGDLILNAGLDNDGGTLTMRDGILHFGNGDPTNSTGNHNLVFNEFSDPQDQDSFNDVVKFVEFEKISGTLEVDSGQLGISETFTPAGNGILNANDHIALVSTSFDNTAIVPEVSSPGADLEVNGLRVQRFITAERSWRFLSNPLIPSASNTINTDWQEGALPVPLSASTNNPHPNFGTHITGGSVADGFDQNVSGLSSLAFFDNDNEQYDNYPTTNDQLEHGKGFYVLIRGDRTVNLLINDYANSPTTTLQTTGSLHIDDYNVSVPAGAGTDGWILLGNPYPTPVDMETVLNNTGTSNMDTDNLWFWEPRAGTNSETTGPGQFVNINLTSGITPTITGSDIDKHLQPGQAVFVQKDDANLASDIEFTESDKVTRTNLTDVFNDNDQIELEGWLRFGLYQPNTIPLEDIAKDGFILKFDDTFSNDINQQDSSKSFADFENMAMVVDNSYISRNARQLPTDLAEIIPIYVENLVDGEYHFSVELENLSSNLTNGIILWDKYEDTYTELVNLETIPFTVDTSIPDSKANDRFAFVFENTTLGIEDNILDGVSLYPNPVITDRVNIKFSEISDDITNVEIFDQLGRKVYTNVFENNGLEIEIDNLNSLSSGVYLLKVRQDNLEKTFKIIKN